MHIFKNNEKISALIRLCLFAIVFSAIFLGLETLFFSERNIHPTWAYAAQEDHEPIDILFVGNSHTYTTIDGELISRATGLNVRSLTCASINGEIVSADLEAFLHYEVPKVVILEMSPFSVDNFETMRKDSLGIVLEHFDGIPDPFVRWKAISKVAPFEDIPSGTFQLLRNTMMWDRWSFDTKSGNSYDAYGSNRKYRVNYNVNFDPDALASYYSAPDDIGDIRMFPRNRSAFHNILTLADQYGFDVWIYNAPIDSFKNTYAGALKYLDEIKDSYPRIKYIDNSMFCLEEIGIQKTDFYDESHLNSNGMEKVSVWMGRRIADRFSVDFQTDSLSLFRDASVTMLEDGRYRYECRAFADSQYRFLYIINGKRVDTGFSAQNWVDDDAIPSKEISSFYVLMRPNTPDAGESDTKTYHFLYYTVEEYTAALQGNSLQITNNSNFTDALTFAWDVTNTETGASETYMYEASNVMAHTFTESGTYSIRAYTRQELDNVQRISPILTVQYDAQSGIITVIDAMDCVNLA